MNFMKYSLADFSKILLILIFTTLISNQILQNILNKITSNAIKKKFVEQEEFLNKTRLFQSILQDDCDAKQFNLGKECLNKLKQFDKYLLSQNRVSLQYDQESCNKCPILSNSTGSLNNKVYYHTFWNFENFNFTALKDQNRLRMINLNLMSFLATQNLCCSKFILWKLNKFSHQLEEILVNIFQYYIKKGIIEIKIFSIKEFCESGFFKNGVCSQNSEDNFLNGLNLVAVSDLVRFAVLDKYGGIYTDGDTIYLKDMTFLLYLNFAYRWSYLNEYNTAVIGFNKQVNPTIVELLNSINTDQSSLGSLISGFHPSPVSNRVKSLNKLNSVYNYNSLVMLHSYFFDGAWLCNDRQTSRITNSSVCIFKEFAIKSFGEFFIPSAFFQGAYAYHIHYKESIIEKNSYFYHFEKYFIDFIEHLNTSIYEQFHNFTTESLDNEHVQTTKITSNGTFTSG